LCSEIRFFAKPENVTANCKITTKEYQNIIHPLIQTKLEVLAVKNIDNSNFCVIYKNFRTVIMEVFDQNFKSIQISKLGITDDNQVGGYFIFNNNLVQLKFSNGNAYLLCFELSKVN
jgi:hypothetical protein